MAMDVRNNMSAIKSLNRLNKNNDNLAKSLKKVSSGVRITGAADDASGYSISEKMRVMIRSLEQDMSNSQNGVSLVKTAEGGIQNIVDILSTMKEMAIDSANGHHSDFDRAILQRSFAEMMKEIDDTAASTNYNGIYLLDGRWCSTEDNYTIEKVNETITKTHTTYTYETVQETVTTYETVTETYTETTIVTREEPFESHAVRPAPATSTGVIEPGVIDGVQQPPIVLPTPTDYRPTTIINKDGVYIIPKEFYGTLDIRAKNVKLVPEDVHTTYGNLNIVTSNKGGTNLWIENLSFGYYASSYDEKIGTSLIKFQGDNNVLTIKGNNFLLYDRNVNWKYGNRYAAYINVGEGLTIEGDGKLIFSDDTQITHLIRGAFIGSNAGEKSNANIIINSGTIAARSSRTTPFGQTLGVIIGAGANGSIGNIIINGGTFDLVTCGGGACIGGGDNSSIGNIQIQNANIKAQCDDGACIGGGSAGDNENAKGSSAGYIYILNSNLDLNNTEIGGHSNWENPAGIGAGIGSGGTYEDATASVGDITVENSVVNIVTDRGACIGTGGDSEFEGTGNPTAQGISIINSTLNLTTNDSRAETIGRGVHGYIPMNTIEEEVVETKERTVTIPRETIVEHTVEVPHTTTVEEIVQREYKVYREGRKDPLIIHTGPKANQKIHVFIKDMHTNAMGLEDVAIDPVKKALEALDKLDTALNYAINENTQMGAYQVRMAETIDTLTTRCENVINSESVIRDADMANAMTEYTKNMILAQAAQSMLAQTNQGLSRVMSLLGEAGW